MRFTSSGRLYQLRIGDSYETVVSTLGCDPYNLLSKQADGYDIYVFKYKIVERKSDTDDIDQHESENAGSEAYKGKEEFDADDTNQRESEKTGSDIYRGKEENVFLVFQNNKLYSVITDEGRKDAPTLVMTHNTLYTFTKNANGEYIMIPTTPTDKEEPKSFQSKKRKKPPLYEILVVNRYYGETYEQLHKKIRWTEFAKKTSKQKL